MSRELQVVVQQTPGTISWNFEELKAGLAEKMKAYENLVYTEENLSVAKQDVAMLRKLRKSVEDRRKEIKNKCLEPYGIIEDQAKQLTGLIDQPIKNISEQVCQYEEDRRAKKKEKIMMFMSKAFADLDPVIAKRLQFKIYDKRWENKTITDDEWLNAVNDALKATEADLEAIGGIEPEFQQTCLEVYKQNLALNEALSKANELRKQQEMIREQERRRAEEEARRRALKEAEKQESQRKIPESPSVVSFADVNKHRGDGEKTEHEAATVPQSNVHAEETARIVEPVQTQDGEYWIYFKGDIQQLRKVLGYIKYVGAECKVKRNVVNG